MPMAFGEWARKSLPNKNGAIATISGAVRHSGMAMIQALNHLLLKRLQTHQLLSINPETRDSEGGKLSPEQVMPRNVAARVAPT